MELREYSIIKSLFADAKHSSEKICPPRVVILVIRLLVTADQDIPSVHIFTLSYSVIWLFLDPPSPTPSLSLLYPKLFGYLVNLDLSHPS